MGVVLGADFFGHRLLDAPVPPDRRPRIIESIGVLGPDGDFQRLAALGQLPALGDVQLIGVRRAVIDGAALEGGVRRAGVDQLAALLGKLRQRRVR